MNILPGMSPRSARWSAGRRWRPFHSSDSTASSSSSSKSLSTSLSLIEHTNIQSPISIGEGSNFSFGSKIAETTNTGLLRGYALILMTFYDQL